LSKVSTQSQFSFAPARLSPTLEALFPAGVVAAEMREAAEHIGRAVPKRVREFAAGRLCARLALHSFGITDVAIPVAPDRQPIWPAGWVGSISHTSGLCLAVVADQARISAIGVDCEVVGHVKPDIWPTICTAADTEWLGSLPPPHREPAVALLFSAKEAVYKCQYPLTREWMDFHDLETLSDRFDPARGRLALRPTRPLRIQGRSPAILTVEYLFHEGFVTTGMALPARR
jgi:4'-phosphopantetheinyl transferase EntD